MSYRRQKIAIARRLGLKKLIDPEYQSVFYIGPAAVFMRPGIDYSTTKPEDSAEIKRTTTIRRFRQAYIEYRHVIDLDTDEVHLQRLNEDAETPEDEWTTLLRYDPNCNVLDMEGAMVGRFHMSNGHWVFDPRVTTEGWQLTTCEHTSGVESLLDSEVTISKLWLAAQP